MAARTKLPPVDEIERRLRCGDTMQQIADDYGSSRAAVSLKLHRAGKPRRRVSHKDVLPWHVATRHQNNYLAIVLRLEGRRRKGVSMSPREERMLTNWRRDMLEDDQVVVYDYSEGFFVLDRKDAYLAMGAPAEGFDSELIHVSETQAQELRS